jgi:hypothetical protein
MNPLALWTNLTPWTKRIIIIGFFLVVIVSMFTGYFPQIIEIFRNMAKLLPGIE